MRILRRIFIWLGLVRPTYIETLKHLLHTVSQKDYENSPAIQGAKLEVESLARISVTEEIHVPLHAVRYTLPNGREVFLTNRPDVVTDHSAQQFIYDHNPGVRFMFTDDLVDPACVNGPPWHWFPWVPSKHVGAPIENIYAFIAQMDYYNRTAPIAHPAWLHCDSSSMRAPTFFGCYLKALYPNEFDAIKASVVTTEGNRDTVSDITYYTDVEFKAKPETKKLVEYWATQGPAAAYHFYMGYDEWINELKDQGAKVFKDGVEEK